MVPKREFAPFQPKETNFFDISRQQIIILHGYESDKGIRVVEGHQYPFEQGLLTVKKFRWKQIAGTVEAVIQDKFASETRMVFPKPGVVEIVSDVELSFSWGTEQYSWTHTPTFSDVHVSLPVEGTTVFKDFPAGLIQGTSREFETKSITLKINQQSRVFNTVADLTMDPPWLIATSSAFPDSPPLSLDSLAGLQQICSKRSKNSLETLNLGLVHFFFPQNVVPICAGIKLDL